MQILLALTLAAFSTSFLAACQVSSSQGAATADPFYDRHHSKGRDD